MKTREEILLALKNTLTCDWQPWHLLHSSRDGTDERDDKANDTEDNGTRPMLGDGVHHDGEGKDVACHDEDEEEELSTTQDFATNATGHDLTGITHTMDVRISHFELTNDIASVGRQTAETDDDDDATVCQALSEWCICMSQGAKLDRAKEGNRKEKWAYGAIPIWATAPGSDKIPKETVSAIITGARSKQKTNSAQS